MHFVLLGKELGTRTFLCWPNPLESARFCNPKTRPSRLALSKEREWGEGELLPARLTVNRTSQSSCKTTKASRAREYHKAAAIPLRDRNGLVHQSKLQGLRGRSSSGPFIKRAWKVVITIHKSLGEDTEAYKDPRADERTSRDSNPASVTHEPCGVLSGEKNHTLVHQQRTRAVAKLLGTVCTVGPSLKLHNPL